MATFEDKQDWLGIFMVQVICRMDWFSSPWAASLLAWIVESEGGHWAGLEQLGVLLCEGRDLPKGSSDQEQ